jgi:F-type H+-transporting ATPase subunit epsilon
MPIHVELVTQERKVFEEKEADIVIIPAADGEMGVLPHHAPVLTTLGFGELVVRKQGREERFAIYGGVVDVRPDKVVAESSFALDRERIEAARESARRMLESGVPAAENREAALALRRAELSLRIHNKIRSRGQVLRIVEDDDQN